MGKQETQERRMKLKKLIEQVGLWNINQSALSVQLGVSQQQISKDIKRIVTQLQPDEIGEIRANLYLAYKRAIAKTQNIMSIGNTREQLEAARTLAQIGDKFTRMLEDYSIKERVAEKLSVEGQVTYQDFADAFEQSKEEQEE